MVQALEVLVQALEVLAFSRLGPGVFQVRLVRGQLPKYIDVDDATPRGWVRRVFALSYQRVPLDVAQRWSAWRHLGRPVEIPIYREIRVVHHLRTDVYTLDQLISSRQRDLPRIGLS